MSNYNIIGFGEVLWDMFPEGRQLGGAPANFVYHAHAMGAKGYLVSRVGEDVLGHEIFERLKDLGVDAENVSVDSEHPTGTVKVNVDEAGKPSYDITDDVAWDYIPFSAELAQLAKRADAVCFGTLCSRNEVSRTALLQFLDAATETTLRVFDINLRQQYYDSGLIASLLERADVFKLSDDELPVVANIFDMPDEADAAAEALARNFQLQVVALTRGGKGSTLYSRGTTSERPAVPGAVVDTVGAGDSFTAGLTVGLLRNWPLDEVNLFASKVATFVCGQAGATPALPEDFRVAK